MATDEWIKDVVYIYTLFGIPLSHKIKKEKVLPFATIWMGLEELAKWNESDRE